MGNAWLIPVLTLRNSHLTATYTGCKLEGRRIGSVCVAECTMCIPAVCMGTRMSSLPHFSYADQLTQCS